MERDDESRLLNDAEVRRILTRAADIENRDDLALSLAEVRRIAIEAGIAPRAVERAIQESRAIRETAPPTVNADAQRPPLWKRVLRAVGIFSGGAALAVATIAVDPFEMGPEASMFLMTGTAAFTFIRALHHRTQRNSSGLQAELATLMCGALLILAAQYGFDSVQAGMVWWVICAIAGVGLVSLGVRPRSGVEQPQKL